MIVVAGESLIDLVAAADGSERATLGGGPFNVARGIARLGRQVAFVGRLSSDPHGRGLRAALVADGVDLTWAPETDDPTLLAHAELDEHGAATYRFSPERSAASGLTAADVAGVAGQSTEELAVGTLGLVLEPMADAIEALVHAAPPDALVLLDPNIRPAAIRDASAVRARLERLLRRVDVVKASVDDLGWLDPEAAPADAARDLVGTGPAVVFVTAGDQPVHVVTAAGVRLVDVPHADVVDTVGAGDAFCAGFLAAWSAAGRTRAELRDDAALVAAVTFAVRMATMTVTRAGADPPTLADLGGSFGDQRSG